MPLTCGCCRGVAVVGGQLRQDRGERCHHRTPYSTALWRVYILYCVTVMTLALARSSPCFASQEARVVLLQQQADELDHVMDALQRAAGGSFDVSKVTALLIVIASGLPFSCLLV
jgi:hypothetical protein